MATCLDAQSIKMTLQRKSDDHWQTAKRSPPSSGSCRIATFRKIPPKSTPIHAGEKAETLYYIVKGTVAVLIKDDEGKEMILLPESGGISWARWGCSKRTRIRKRSAWVRAKGACEVAEISYKKFRQPIQVNPDILLRLSGQMAKRLQHTSQKVGNLAFRDVTGRDRPDPAEPGQAARRHDPPGWHANRITRQEIGQIVGCSAKPSAASSRCWKSKSSSPPTARP